MAFTVEHVDVYSLQSYLDTITAETVVEIINKGAQGYVVVSDDGV